MTKNAEWKGQKDFDNLYVEIVETKKKITLIDAQLENLTNNLQYYNINQRELSAVPAGANTYQSIGRMFILQDKEEIMQSYKERDAELREKITNLRNTKQRLELYQKNKSDNLREIIEIHKRQGQNNDN